MAKMAAEPPVPETRVLAVASHVVSGYVGNKIAVLTMQSLGCDVAALNTVQFSNHTGYKQFKGTRATAQEITDLYDGLKQSYLDDFDMMLTGYIPGAAAVEAVGKMAQDQRQRTASKPGSFFWVLDPVMGDHGTLYVAPEVVPAYKSLLKNADLILPNQFEAELLSEVEITDMTSLHHAIQVLHKRYHIPHIVITSINLDTSSPPASSSSKHPPKTLSVIGSSMRSDHSPRAFKITFPAINAYFSGTGDMFAALMVVRMRQAVHQSADAQTLEHTASWLSPDDACSTPAELPLAKAAELTLASMHEVLGKTAESMHETMAKEEARIDGNMDEKKMHLLRSKAAELKLVRHLDSLRAPKVQYRAEAL